jgi:hypothetical protein
VQLVLQHGGRPVRTIRWPSATTTVIMAGPGAVRRGPGCRQPGRGRYDNYRQGRSDHPV